jgi:feruloyl-CoA synthase
MEEAEPLAPFRDVPFLDRNIEVDRRADGTVILRNRIALNPIAPHLPWYLRRNAVECGDRTWLAQRQGAANEWVHLTYAEALSNVDAVTQWLLDLDRPGRPVMVLSGNSIEHGVLALAAMQASMPHVPVTPAYSLKSSDFGTLRSMVDTIDPAVLFVQDAEAFSSALAAVAGPDRLVVCVRGTGSVVAHSWHNVVQTLPTPDVARAIDAIDHDTVAKYMFTSASTGAPKAVTITQRMIVTATASNAMNVDRSRDPYRTLMVDWLPWSHVAGGTAVFHRILEEQGTLYIDAGRPTPTDFDTTLENLRELSPSNFSSMPLGYAKLVEAMDSDPELAHSFFENLRFATYSGARLPDDTYQRFQFHAVEQTGHRVPFTAGYGSTETLAAAAYVYWASERTGLVGLPQAGIELKLVPMEGERYEIRVKSDTVTPGYLDRDDLNSEARDEDGYFRMGDSAAFVDPNDPSEGLVFTGRVAEEFKLLSGTFVRVTSLRVTAVDAAAPFLTDVVVAGADRAFVALLVWLNAEGVRSLIDGEEDIRMEPRVREVLRSAFAQYNLSHPGMSTRVDRILILTDAPSQARGEINDKGYINQRRVLELRTDEVSMLYAEPVHPMVIEIP